MGRLVFLILSLFFLLVLISATLGDVRELFNHPEGDRRYARAEVSDKSDSNYEGAEKAMDGLYSSLEDYYGSHRKRPFNFNKPDFEKNLVHALNRIKYIDRDFNKHQPRKTVLSFGDNLNTDKNFNSHGINYEEEKNKVESIQNGDEFDHLNEVQAENNDKKEIINFKNSDLLDSDKNSLRSFRPRKNYLFLDKNKHMDANYGFLSDGNNENDNFQTSNNENDFLMQHKHHRHYHCHHNHHPQSEIKNDVEKTSNDDVKNQENEENRHVGYDNDDENLNILHASFKNMDEHNENEPLYENTAFVKKNKRLPIIENEIISNTGDGDNINKNENSFDANGNDIMENFDSSRKKEMNKREENRLNNNYVVNLVPEKSSHQNSSEDDVNNNNSNYNKNNNIHDNINDNDVDDNNNNIDDFNHPLQFFVASITGSNNSNDYNSYNDNNTVKEGVRRNKRKDSDLKILSDALNSNIVNNLNYNNNTNKNNNDINNNFNREKLSRLNVGNINDVGGNTNTLFNLRNSSRPVLQDSYSSVDQLVTTTSPVTARGSSGSTENEIKRQGTSKSRLSAMKSIALAAYPFGSRTTVGLLSKYRKDGSMIVLPSMTFNRSSSNVSEEVRITHEIEDFVANVLNNAAKTSNMRKELGLCKGYDKNLPLPLNKPVDNTLMDGIMECLGRVIKDSIESQRCIDMPEELKEFLEWLLLNGISARDEFKQYMNSDVAQKKSFLFSQNDATCDDNKAILQRATTVRLPTVTLQTSFDVSNSTPSSEQMQKTTSKINRRKLIGTIKKYLESPSGIFGGSSNLDKDIKNSDPLLNNYVSDTRVPSVDDEEQKLYRDRSSLYKQIRYNNEDTVNDWNMKNRLFERSDVESEGINRYDNDLSINSSPNRIDLSRYYRINKPRIGKTLKRDNDDLGFETAVDDREPYVPE